MQILRRAAAIPALVLTLAACAAPGGGAGTNQPEPSMGSSSVSPSAAAAVAGGERVDIAAVAQDPGSFEGRELSILAHVDETVVAGSAFLTSPSASDQDQVLVVVRPDATVDKEPAVGNVVWVDGKVVNFTPEDLQAAGLDLTAEDLGGFDGESVFVADALRDPLAGA